MPASHPSWKGYLRLSLVSIPVKVFTASESSGEIHLRQLHKDCSTPIRYQKTCPLHGEVESHHITSGYEYEKGRFVLVDPAETAKLRGTPEKAIVIDGFVAQDEIDPLYHSGKTHYLLPDGPAGERPYLLLAWAMAERGRAALSRVFTHGREHLALVRPAGRLLAVTHLSYPEGVRRPEHYAAELPELELPRQELELAGMLVDESELEGFDLARYKDPYGEAFRDLVKLKLAGREVVSPPAAEVPRVIDLMQALKASLRQVQSRRKMAPSVRPREKRKRKSG